jgi:hypothetical protein
MPRYVLYLCCLYLTLYISRFFVCLHCWFVRAWLMVLWQFSQLWTNDETALNNAANDVTVPMVLQRQPATRCSTNWSVAKTNTWPATPISFYTGLHQRHVLAHLQSWHIEGTCAGIVKGSCSIHGWRHSLELSLVEVCKRCDMWSVCVQLLTHLKLPQTSTRQML